MADNDINDAQILDILNATKIDGLDIGDALGRLNNSAKIFMRIIHSFIQNMPATLDELAQPAADNLSGYSIKVHGAKGSLYGIGAIACGDNAKALEMASKAGDLKTVLEQNDAFIASVNILIDHLAALAARIDAEALSALPQKTMLDAPDKDLLKKLLDATQEYDIDLMRETIEDLIAKKYASGEDDIKYIREQFESFAYDKIEQKLMHMIVR